MLEPFPRGRLRRYFPPTSPFRGFEPVRFDFWGLRPGFLGDAVRESSVLDESFFAPRAGLPRANLNFGSVRGFLRLRPGEARLGFAGAAEAAERFCRF